MKVRSTLSGIAKERGPVVLAAGFFDGVHRGHQAVLRAAARRAATIRGAVWVLTFDTHPMKVLCPARAPRLLTCRDHRLRLFERMGIDGCLMLRFTRRLAAMEPGRFARQLVRQAPPLSEVVIGPNWHFGRGGAGTPALLAQLGAPRGLRVTVVRPVPFGGRTVSSTTIRRAVFRGSLDDAARMLGHPFSILGRVVPGRRVGRLLGFPTANLDCGNEVLPPRGVYACCAMIGREFLPGVVNLGVRPTFAGPADAKSQTIELHLPGRSLDLYGRDVEVFFLRRIRPERRFASTEALRRQIARDVGAALRALPAGKVRRLKESLYTASISRL